MLSVDCDNLLPAIVTIFSNSSVLKDNEQNKLIDGVKYKTVNVGEAIMNIYYKQKYCGSSNTEYLLKIKLLWERQN